MTARPAEPHALLSDTAILARAATELATKFADVFATETVERYVFESYTALRRTAKIKTHLVPLTVHFATDRLTALAQAQVATATPLIISETSLSSSILSS